MPRSQSDINNEILQLKHLIARKKKFCDAAKQVLDPYEQGKLLPNYMPTNDDHHLLGVTYERLTYSHTVTPMTATKHGEFVRDIATDIEGVTRHRDNKFLYLSVAPRCIQAHLTDNLVEITSQPQLEEKIATRKIKMLIQRLCNLHPKSKPTFIVLGKKAVGENVEGYKTLWSQDKTFKIGNIDKYVVKADLEVNIPLYYLEASNQTIDLDSESIHFLHSIYEQTIAKNTPLLIHCDDGKARTAKLAYAFELFRNYRFVFKDPSNLQIAYKLANQHEMLSRSRCIDALSQPRDFEQAINIGMSLKACALAKESFDNLTQYSEELKTKSIAKNSRLTNILNSLQAQPSLTDKINLLQDAIINDELKRHRNFTFLPEFINRLRADTQSIALLKTLKNALEQRVAIEAEIVNFVVANGKEEENILPTL